MKNALLVSGMILFVAVAGVWAGPDGDSEKFFVISQYLIEVEGTGDETISLTGSKISFRGGPRDFTVLSGDQQLQVGKLVLSVGPSGELMGNGSPIFQPEVGFRVVSAPRVVVVEGGEAILRSGMVSQLQYLDRQPDGTFSLESVESGAGMTMKLVVRSSTEADVPSGEVNLEFGVKTTFMVGRDAIPGVDLEIGKPVFETREVQSRLRVPLDQWMLLHSITAKDGSNGDSTRLISMMHIVDGEGVHYPVPESQPRPSEAN